MKKILLLFLASIFWMGVYSQQERQVSQYMFDLISVNPGSAGSTDMISTHAILRQQWVGIPGAPEDFVVNMSAPFKLFKVHHGVGLSISDDKLGFNDDVSLSLSYAFQFQLGNGKLGLGLSGSFMSRNIDPTWSIPTSPAHQIPANDGAIPLEKQSKNVFDLGAGLFYRSDDIYVGLSSTHLREGEFVYSNSSTSPGSSESNEKLKRHYYLTAGYTMQMSNPAFELIPSLMLQSDLSATKIDLNATVMYNKKFWGGVSYRVGAAVVGMIGIDILNGVKIGYSYDFDTSALNNASKGSHEIMVGYDFKIGIEKTPQKYKSIRFL